MSEVRRDDDRNESIAPRHHQEAGSLRLKADSETLCALSRQGKM